MKVLRLGVVGLGQRIAHVLKACAETGWRFELAGYVDPQPIGLPILQGAGIAPGRPYKSVESFFADGPFDLVLIGSPNHLHYEHLLAAFAAGFPIFCEKPIVRTEEETFALARHLADGETPPLYIGLVMRSMPIVRDVIARVDEGQLGEVVSLDTTEHLPPEHGGYLARNWRRKQEWGGSFYLDKVCHDFDIFGRIAGVFALLGSATFVLVAYRVLILHHREATPAVFLMLLMFITALIALMSGLLAEIIVRVLYQAGGRAPYTIAERIGFEAPQRAVAG